MENQKSFFRYIPIAILGVLLSGFLFNRVLFSIGLTFAIVYAVYNKFWENKSIFSHVGISIICIVALYFISDILHSGLLVGGPRSWLKLIFFSIFIFITTWKPNKKITSQVNHLFIFTGLVISMYSLVIYFTNFSSLNLQYGQAKVMPVLSFGDHIRVSWFIVATCVVAFYEQLDKVKYKKWAYIGYLVFQFVFLHILGAKTGLLSLYLMALILGLGYIIKAKKYHLTVPLLLIIIAAPVIAYKALPSFKNRIHFIKYDYQNYVNGDYKDGLSDAIRFYSLIGGVKLFKEKPFFGHGFEKSKSKMANWYKNFNPDINKASYTLPSNQFLIFGIGFGVFGIAFFIYHIISPLLYSNLRSNIIFMSFYLPTTSTFLYETHLESQMAIFIYALMLTWVIHLAGLPSPTSNKI